MGSPIFQTLAGFVLVSSTAYGLAYDVFLKEGKKVVNLHREGKNLVVEEAPIGEGLPLFETFKVECRKGKLLLEWKPSDPSVEKVLVVTDGGKIKITTSRRLEFPAAKGGKFLRIFPVGEDGKIGLPAEVEIDG